MHTSLLLKKSFMLFTINLGKIISDEHVFLDLKLILRIPVLVVSKLLKGSLFVKQKAPNSKSYSNITFFCIF